MIKIVIAEGCSLTSGAEHADWQMVEETGLEYSETSWAGYIRNICFPNAVFKPTARCGGSQSHIRRRALFYLNEALETYKPEEILFLVQWTDPNRTELRVQQHKPTRKFSLLIDEDESHYIYSLPIDFPNTHHLGNNIVDQKDRNTWLATNRVKTIFNEYNLYHVHPETNLYNSFSEIETVRNFCELKGIKMFETVGFGDLAGYYNPLDSSKDKFVDRLIKHIDIKNTAFLCNEYKPEGLLEFTKRTGGVVGPGGHPLEAANQHWAKMMINYYNLDKLE